jgi:DNA-binding transcriptional regulator YdaS (Cro superfamily)
MGVLMSIPAGQAVITTSALAAELGVHPDSISRMARERADIKAARWTRGRFLVQRLRDSGILPRVEAQP